MDIGQRITIKLSQATQNYVNENRTLYAEIGSFYNQLNASPYAIITYIITDIRTIQLRFKDYTDLWTLCDYEVVPFRETTGERY